MVRKGKKQKYRDVVGKKKEKPTKNKPKNRKTYSLYKNDNKKSFGKKRKFEHDGIESRKKPNVEAPVQRPVQYDPSSESEEELLDDMAQLRQTLGVNSKKLLAIESEDESLSDEQSTVEDEVIVDELDESDSENFGVEDGIEKNYSEVDSSEDESEADVYDENKIGDDASFIQKEIGEMDAKEEFELDPEDKEGVDLESCDPFGKHIFFEIHDDLIETLQKIPISHETHIENWSKLGKLIVQIPKSDQIKSVETVLDEESTLVESKHYAPLGQIPVRNDIKKLDSPNTGIKTQIIGHLAKCNKSLIDKGGPIFTSFQNELFSIINNYQDLFFSERTFDNAEDLKFVYCLHAVNHILKTRTKVLHHNARLSKKNEVPEEFRDQGLVRPKILIIVPFKDAAYKIINTIIEILYPEDKGNVMNKKRFLEEFTGNEINMPKKNPKPEDYELTFTGNTSDEFKVGITLTKKSLKLYADFYSSDIIVASPLGLRMIIGAEGEQERDYDFLASIELLIVDQAELFLMQNWDHLLHIFNHLHLQPKDSHGTDFSRVRLWSLNGWAKYYRQTLIFSSIVLPEINSIFNKRCANYAGKVKTSNLIEFGTISQVVVQLPHVFHKFEAGDVSSAIDARFDFFVEKILPHQRDALMKQSLIFVANYFDFVRLRNYFKREDMGFTQICEYSKDGKIARARDMFFHGDSHFMLYTERYHFFNRIRIKGIRHLVFYQLPNFPHFYYEMCNLMQETNMNKKVGNMSNMTVTVLYSKYDVHQLAAIAGTERASKMTKSDRNVHMMVTGT